MREVGAPKLERDGGEEAWTVFAGYYDRSAAPVTVEGLTAVEQALQELKARLSYSDTVIDRARKVETLVYVAGLCDPRVANDPATREQAYRDFARGAMLLSGYKMEDLRLHAEIELSHLDSRPIPVLGAVEDMKARGLMDPLRVEELGVIARLAAISELNGKLPPVRQPRD